MTEPRSRYRSHSLRTSIALVIHLSDAESFTLDPKIVKRTPGLLAEYSIPARVMVNFFETPPKLPAKVRCDNGPEMSSREFRDWADKNGIEIEYIEPGKPVQNAYEFKDLASTTLFL